MKSLYLKICAVVLALLIPAAAVALSLDPIRNISARQLASQQVTYYRFTVNYNDRGIASAVKFGRLLQNTFITDLKCHVTTAFNATSTNVLTAGTSTTATEIWGASDVNEASATFQNLTSAAGLGVAATSGGDVDLYVKYAQTGTAATAGQAICTISFIPNNDM